MQKRILLKVGWLCLGLVGFVSACVPVNSSANSLGTVHTKSPIPTITLSPTPIPTSTTVPLDVRPRSWHTYAYIDWEHDGLPYESEYFWVYSDSVRMWTREQFALDAESALERILPIFEESAGEAGDVRFLYPKMEIFVSSQHFGEVYWQGYAHYGGFLIVFDAEYYRNYTHTFPDYFPYSYVVAHELTHVLSARLVGYREYDVYHAPHAWFDEGLATYFGIHPFPIRTLQLYEIAMAGVADRSAEGNPVHIRYSPTLGYPENLYELAVYYLIETYGIENVIGVLVDMRSGLSFEHGFENRFGMSVDQYEQDFDALIRDFLAED